MAGIFDTGIFDTGIFDTEAIPGGGGITEGIDVRGLGIAMKVNGVDYTIPELSANQLGQWSFQDAAYDGQIGMGSICIPQNPGWVAGDRLAFYDQDGDFITSAFVMDRGITRQNIERTGFETKYQLMDANRLLIGRKLVDYRPGGDGPTQISATADQVIGGVIGVLGLASPPITLDSTTFVDSDSTLMPNRTYNSDGATDLIADLILYTGKTVFLRAIEDNSYELHFHSLSTGDAADITISDELADQGTDVFTPFSPSVSWNATDLKNDILATNQLGTVVSDTNAGSVTAHGAGGLGFEAVLSYGSTDDELISFVANIINTAGDEKPTYQCAIGPLVGSQVAKIAPGTLVNVTSEVMDLTSSTDEVLRLRTLTITHDEGGSPVPGLWTATLQLAYPLRAAATALGIGGLGGYLGGMAAAFGIATRVDVTYGDYTKVPVGGAMDVRGLIESNIGQAIVNPKGYLIEFHLVELEADDYTESDDWSLSGETVVDSHTVQSHTDATGYALCMALHDSDVSWDHMRIEATIVGFSLP